ncbi:MAG TPA: VOC family protein [Hyphomicrobiaceae bacterium]|nr:VOC family protein [Hyphomicrobiaceae bacterium]
MALKSIIGLDHVVILVRNLNDGAETWRKLGFTVAPRGMHTAVMGTANHTIMLGEDYIELIGVVAETERNLQSREFLASRGEGIERAAFTTTSAADGVAEIKARGLAGTGPFDFGRPVDLPDGRKTEARFRTFLWPVGERPGGLRIFACEHLTRDAVWIPELTKHANTATRIDRVELLAKDPQAGAEHMARLIDQPVEPEADGAFRVATGRGRGAFVFLDRPTLQKRHPGVALDSLPEEGAVALVLRVARAEAAADAVGGRGIMTGPGVLDVPPKFANGLILELVEA